MNLMIKQCDLQQILS